MASKKPEGICRLCVFILTGKPAGASLTYSVQRETELDIVVLYQYWYHNNFGLNVNFTRFRSFPEVPCSHGPS